MTTDQLKAAIERTLREGLPANANGAAQTLRLEHSGSVTVTVEIRGLPSSAAPAGTPSVALVPQRGVDELLRRLDAIPVRGRVGGERPQRPSPFARMIFNPSPALREHLRNQP